MPELESVAVIGAGLMGHGIAQVFAAKGHDVSLSDLDDGILETAFENIRANLTLMAEKGMISSSHIAPALERVTLIPVMAEAVQGARVVFEAVSENRELKQNLFAQMDALCPEETLLATNTSVISITEIAQKARKRGRILGTHFWNPPYLIPLVEVIRGQDTDGRSMERAFSLLKRAGKHPVRVNRDVPGFVGNRLQHALWREAISIVEQGIADAATVDECIRFGFGLRLPVLGPMENVDMVGTDLTLAIHDYLFKHLARSAEASPLLKRYVEEGRLGFKSGEGFQKWSSDDIERSRKRLVEHLLKITS